MQAMKAHFKMQQYILYIYIIIRDNVTYEGIYIYIIIIYRHYYYSVLFFLHNCPLLIPLHNTAVLIKICRVFFLSTLLNLCKPLRNWTFQHFARAAHKKGRNGTNEKNLTLARTRTQVHGISSADALPTKLRVPVGGTEFLSL